MATFKLTGSILDAKTGKGMADLAVEAWARTGKTDKRLSQTTTNAEGHFVTDFNVSNQALGRRPVGVIKIFSGDILLHTTPEKPVVEWAQQPPFIIKLDPPTTPENSVQLFVSASVANGKPAAGARLVLSYELPAGSTWTSQPVSADAHGKLTVDIPTASPGSIDWSRIGFAFSKNDKPLRVIDQTPPEPVMTGFAIAVKLGQDKIPWPPEQDPNKWYVRGRVSTPYGEAVVANVSGAAISLQSEKSIGQAPTSDAGRYEIIYEWDGKCAPDIQVSATVQDKLVAQSAIRFAVGKSVRIDLIAGNELYIGPTEFQTVEDRVLRCNDDFDISIIGKKQFDYLLGKTRLAEDRLSFYLIARKLHSLCDVPTAVFYGLFRAKLPATLQGLVLQPPKVLQKALNTSIRQNIIDRKYKNALDSLLAALRQMAVVGSLNNNQQLDHAVVGDLLTMAEVPASAQEQLVNLYLEHDGDDAAFWETLGKDQQLAPYADKTKTTLQTGALTTYHLPTMQAFKTKLGAESTINDLASWQNQDWQAFEKTLKAVPDNIPGDSLADRIGFYVKTMSRTVKRAFAREYTTANVLRSDNFADPILHEFLNAVPDFDYGNSSIPAVLDKIQITGESRKALEKTLKSLQRLYRVAPIEHKFPVLDTLYADGLTSARDITLQGSAQFIDLYSGALGGVDIAASVYDKAATIAAVSTNVLTAYSDLFNASGVYAIGGGVPLSQPDAEGDLAIPSYQDLFGSQSFCECIHCSSVYSPAAYFVDLLEYLGQSWVTKKIGGNVYVTIIKNGEEVNKTGLDVLFARRADLGDIRLDCANTNTLLPYIDLVNEIFERGVVGETDSSPYQTNWTEQELKSNPEHILSSAYDVLAETTYPLTLPFRLWNVEADHYLNHLGAPRWKLMEKLIKLPSTGSDSFEQVSLAYLGLVAIDVEILKGAPEYSGDLAAVGKMWGYSVLGWRTSLASVPEFLKRSGLSYDELLQLLQVPYVQADGQFGIDFSDAESACDIDGAVLRYIDGDGTFDTVRLLSKETFDRIQRFLRLRGKTGWSIWVLGRVLAGLPLPQLTVKTLVQVLTLKRLADSQALDVLEVLSWWANLDTALDTTDPDYRSLYDSVFLNPAVLNPPDEVFLLEEPGRTQLAVEAGAGALISEHFSSIAAALQVSEATATLLAESLPDDALTLNNLSQMYRIASLCRALDIDISQYFLLTRLIGADPWDAHQPQAAMQFLAAVQFQQTSAFTSAELGYLLLHDEASVGSVQMPATSIANLLREIQIAVRAVWIRYVLSNTPSIDQLNARLGDYFDQETIDSIVTMVGQDLPYTPEDQAYLQETLSFLAPVELKNAVAQSKPANVRYKNLLILLNRYGRTSGSVNVVAQMIADIFTLDLAVAQLLLTEVVSRGGHPGEFVINALLEPLFIDSGKEKLAAAIAAEFLQDAFSIIEGTSTMTDADIEAFIVLHLDFLDSEEAKTNLLSGDALSDVVERYQYVTAPLDEAQYTLSEEVFAEQFAAVWTIQKSALVVNKFQITETELPLLNQHAATLQVLPVKGYPFVEQERNFAGFKGWQNLANLLSLRRVFVATDSQLFAQLEKVLNPSLIDIVTPNTEVDALIDGVVWQETDRSLLVWLYELASATGWSFSECAYVAGPELLAASLPDMLNVATLVYLTEVIELAVRLGTTAAQLKAWAALDLSQTDAANAKQTARARYALEQWYGIAPALRDVLREKQRDALTAYMLHLGGFGTTVELYNHYLIDSEMSACMLTSRLKLALSSVQLFLQRCLLNLEDEFVAVTAPEEWEWRKNYRVWEANRKVFLYPENYIKPELRITRSEIFDAAQSVLLQNEVTEDVAEMALLRYLEELDNISNLEVAGSFHETGLADDEETTIDRLHVVARSRGIPRKYYYRVRDGLAWSPWQEIDADISADQVIPVVINSRLYLFWPVFFEKQIAGVDVLSNSAMQDAKEASIEYDEYLNYLLYYEWLVSHGSAYHDGYSTIEEWGADVFNTTLEGTIDILVDDLGAETWEEFLASAIERFDDKFEETFDYFEIKLSVSEYKNGNWMPSRISEDYIESDQKNSALALLDENQIPVTPGDFNFYTTLDDDVVTIECLQTLRYTDGDYAYPYVEGDFEYNILSKEILAFDHKDDRRGFSIETPTGADVVANRFVEDEEGMLEIPLVAGAWWLTTYVTLLEQTPGTFRLPIQHQYEQFAASDGFFFGDDKRSFIVCPDKVSSLVAQYQVLGRDSPLLDGYLNNASPGIGVYDALIHDFSGTTTTGINSVLPSASLERSIPAAKTLGQSKTVITGFEGDLLAGLENTSVAEFYPPMRDVYRFESLYHPLVGDLIKKVNGEGTATALSRDTQRTSEKYFIAAYQPTDDVAEDYPIREFSFSDLDANGFYNYEFFFHLPLLIAVRLSRNQQFAEAQKWFHTIFDPTSRSGDNGAQRFWQFKPFFDMYDNTAGHPFDSIYDLLSALAADPTTADSATLELRSQTLAQITVWRANPFDPHAIAALRPVAYMKTVVMEYLNNLIAWGDYLYEQYTHESINEATLYYMLAYQILGDRPVALPELNVVEKSYNQLGRIDAFSNAVAVADLENLINLPEAPPSSVSPPPPLYFCIPNNPTLLQYWDTVADRLFKIRHCMTIEGVVQQLPLFEPPIDPALLVLARASGVSIGAALASLATPAPYYRFVFLMQKAVEYCHVVKGLGSQLLAAYEKQDAESLGLLRAEHEDSLLKASTELRNLQVDEARENLAAMEKSKVLVQDRIDYYSTLEERSEKEIAATKSLDEAEFKRMKSSDKEMSASRWNLVPNLSVTTGAPPSVGTSFGGSNIGASFSADAAKSRGESAWNTYQASKLGTDASYERRWYDWKLQERLAKNELKQIEKQIIAAQIRLALAEKDRDNHAIQVQQSREVKDFLSSKFSNKELYGWMVSQTSAIYFQSYKLAYDLAKRCEKAYQRESGEFSSSYIAYGYFDSMKKGLMSGERLHHDLQRMEFDYLNNNRREYEITKHVSLSLLDPVALLKLQTEGECEFSIPEAYFDFEYPGHYFRRTKSIDVSIPCVTGPYTGVPARLTLVSSRTRVDPTASGEYAFDPSGEDARFQFDTGAGQSIVISRGQEDPGLFAADHRDERYLPFEGTGAISDWNLKLTSAVPTFDWATITDVVVHLRYTAREGGDLLQEAALQSLTEELAEIPLQRGFSAKHEFSTEWSAFLRGQSATEAALKLDLSLKRFPYFARDLGLKITQLQLVAVVKVPMDLSHTRVTVEGGGASDDVTLASAAELYDGNPSASIGYSEVDPGGWTITVDTTTLGAPSEWIDDFVVIATYQVTIPTD